jgi:hypothetical protein
MATPSSAATRIRATVGRVRRKALALGARDIEPRLVWIFGSPRSGSTWLLKLLGEHERVVAVNEPLIGLYLGQMSADLRDIDIDALDSSNFVVRRLQNKKADNFFAEEFTDVWAPALGEMIRKRFTAHVARYSRDPARALVAIQEPNGSQSADVIMAALPRARFVFLLRDGRDVVDSELAANKPGAWISKAFPGMTGIAEEDRLDFVDRTARKWLWRTEVVQQAFDAHPGPKRLVRYEELRADTPGQLRPLLDWLDLSVSDQRVAQLVERHAFEKVPAEVRGTDAFFRAASPGLWRENMSDEEQQRMEDILGPKLRELGYEA